MDQVSLGTREDAVADGLPKYSILKFLVAFDAVVALPPRMRLLELPSSILFFLVHLIFASTQLLDFAELRPWKVVQGGHHLIHILAKVEQDLFVLVIEGELFTQVFKWCLILGVVVCVSLRAGCSLGSVLLDGLT